jgi:CRP-like cAMP-binding protein
MIMGASSQPAPGALPSSSKTSRISHVFDAQLCLTSAGLGKRVAKFRPKETFFSQGDPGKSVLYIQDGGVKLTVVNKVGKQAVVEILGPGDFFGVRGLSGESVYTATATAILPTTVLVIEKEEMKRVLHAEHGMSDRFIANLLARSIRGEEALIDQLFNSSERRLARTLLLLARYGKPGQPLKVLPKDRKRCWQR